MNTRSLRIERACADAENDAFLQRVANPLVYYSSAYARFLTRAIPGVELHRLAAYEENRLVGVLPYAIKHDPVHGKILNSLPFFGSHGGALVDASAPGWEIVPSTLHEALADLIDTGGFASATLIENPLQPFDADVLVRRGLRVVDDRVGQINPLPREGDIEAKLFALFHEKTRNAVRKGQSQGQTIQSCDDDASLAWLQATHEKSIRSLGGVPKSLFIFQQLLAEFPLGTGSRLYTGSIGGRRVSGLFVLLYGKTVEYFTPVVDEDDRDKQVLSHLIFHVMADLARKGFHTWNWGGTWRSQEGVHRFKKRWGATDHVYRYFNRCEDSKLRALPRGVLAEAFPWFYLYNYQAPVLP